MSFPSQDELIKLNEEGSEKLIDITIISEDEDNDNSDNLASWEIVAVDKTLIELQLVFSSPLSVSSGDTADKLIVQVSLSKYPDENGAFLPASINRVKAIPLQFSSAEEAEIVASAGSSALSTTASTCGI